MIEFSILGPLEVRSGAAVVPIRGSRQKALLAMLLLQANKVVSADRLMDEIWGAGAGTDSVALRVRISQLRKALHAAGGADLIRTRAPGYVLVIDRDRLDLGRHEKLVADAAEKLAVDPAAAAAGFREALGLWRGPALADFSYEPFAQTGIGQLEELRLLTLEKWIDAELAAGHEAEIVGELGALVAAHPLRERFRGQLMLALYRAGRQAEALEEYQCIRGLLIDELGIEPGPALRDLHQALLAHDPALDRPERIGLAAPEQARVISTPGTRRETRSIVTALVCDFGLSRCGQTLDAEVRRRLLDSCSQVATPVLVGHGGTMENFIGDLALAVFGHPTLREDDALRAVRAAVEVRHAMRPVLEELGSLWGVGLSPRFGIASGEVLLGDETTLLSGRVVDTASGLQQAAGPSEILMCDATWELSRGAVRAERADQGQESSENKDAGAWRLIAISDSSPAIYRRLDTPFIGRTNELAQIRTEYELACSESTPRVVTVLGDPGIGKSRLAEHARLRLFADAQVFAGRCYPYGEGVTFAPLREIVGHVLDGAEPDALADLFTEDPDGPQVAAMVGGLLGFSSVAGRLDEGFWAVRRLCEVLARRKPLVLVFEDLHWADATMLDLIGYIAETASEAPMLLVCLARPEMRDQHPPWSGGPDGTVIALEPLTTSQTGELADWLIRDAGSARDVRAQVVDAAQGNPLFAEQLVAMLADDDRQGDEPPLPVAVQAVIAARFELLGPAERTALEYASALGERFAVEALARLVPPEIQPALGRHLRALVRKQFLRPAQLPGSRDAFRFRHVLVRAAACRRLPMGQRADIHERYADWLGSLPPGGAGSERAELLGYHLERAYMYRAHISPGDAGLGDLAERAAGHLAAAGTAAFARADFRAADQLTRRAVALMATDDARRPGLLYDRGTSLITLGRLAEADDVLTQAAQAAELNDDVPTHWRARLDRVIARTAIDPGNASIHEHELLAREAIRVLERHGDDRGMARAWIVIGQIEEMRGRVSEGEQAAQHVLRYARRGGTYREVAFARFGIAEAILAGQLPADAGIARCDELLPALTDLRVGDVALLAAAALLHAMRGEFHAGRQLIAQGRELVERLGHTNPLVFTLQRAGELELIAADAAAAETTFRQALCLADRSGNSGARAEVAALLARAVLAQGREAEAQELAAQARAGAEPERLPAQARWRAVQAAIHTARGETEDAVVLAAAADDMLRETELLPLRAEVLTDLAVALAAHGDKPAAGRAAQRALDLHIRKGNIVGAASVRQQFGVAATTEARS